MNKQRHYWHSLLFILLGLLLAAPVAFAQNLKTAGDQPKWVNELPQPPRLNFMNFNGNGNPVQRFIMREGPGHDFGLYDSDDNPIGPVPAWAYEFVANGNNPNLSAAATYLGPTIEAYRDRRIKIRWENNLPGNHLLLVDNSLHMPHLAGLSNIPAVTHLHGGHTESASDGLPEAWYTAGLAQTGPYFVKDVYTYDNDQEAATLWYHDHTLGVTRLNVYAGLAGFYLLRDDNEMQLINEDVLPSGPYEREIVIQDRQFAANGHLYMPADGGSEDDCTGPETEFPLPNAPLPVTGNSIVAEFFGQYITVNGKAWPYLNVEPRKYRLRLLNGSDSRVYLLNLRKVVTNAKGEDVPSMDPGDILKILQIGTDNGLREDPVLHDGIRLAPGERVDVVVDFEGWDGEALILTNVGPDEPFKGGNQDPADPNSSGLIMRFNVNQPLDPAVPQASVDENTDLRPLYSYAPGQGLSEMFGVAAHRKLVLFEGRDQYCRLRPQLGIYDPGNPLDGSLMWDETITENPMLGDKEVWDIINMTEDAHPIHLHLVSFKILKRGAATGTIVADPAGDPEAGGTKLLLDGYMGMAWENTPPESADNGWKDTGVVGPGEVMRVIARFDRKGRYVWHCHILSHEDHEMMRPFHVGNIPMDFNSIAQVEIPDAVEEQAPGLVQNAPNPFSGETNIVMNLPQDGPATVIVTDLNGRMVTQLAGGLYAAGQHTLTWDGRNEAGSSTPNGVYICQLKAGDLTSTVRMVKY